MRLVIAAAAKVLKGITEIVLSGRKDLRGYGVYYLKFRTETKALTIPVLFIDE